MTVNASLSKQAIVTFIRDEAPLEFERLQSIGRLASTWPDSVGDRSDLGQFSYARWVREALGLWPA
jgi:hypothetical protein